ncbi:MAG: hypothetical protein HY872_11995 [Chloroflexi bacterium]|nr:hypothetical protein [Chloroflexota bacterium]
MMNLHAPFRIRHFIASFNPLKFASHDMRKWANGFLSCEAGVGCAAGTPKFYRERIELFAN